MERRHKHSPPQLSPAAGPGGGQSSAGPEEDAPTGRTSPAVTLPFLELPAQRLAGQVCGIYRSSIYRSPGVGEGENMKNSYFHENLLARLHVLLAFPPKCLLRLSSFHLHILLRVEC